MKGRWRIVVFCLLFFVSPSVFGQVTEQFTDGDFTQNPTWDGDVGDFEVQNQQLRLVSTGTDTSFLSTPNTVIDNAEWNFWVRLSFAPSDNNLVRLYLVSDQADLKGPLNGYFLRYGENGSLDNLELWRQSGTTVTKIFDAAPSPNAALTNQFLRIKVLRQTGGLWEIFVDYAGGFALQSQGTVTDNTFHTAGFIGMWCRYTTTNASGFYFDDIYAGPVIVDTDPPQVLSLSAPAADSVWVVFSEPVTQASAQNAANYSLSGGIGNPSAVLYNPSQADRVTLVLSSPLVSEQVYDLQISGVQDFAGNTLNSFSGQVSFYSPLPFDLLITEIMADPTPTVGLPDAEFVEIFNRKNFPINLSGWKLRVNSTTRNLPPVTIGPGEYLVLTSNPPNSGFQGIPVAGVVSFPVLPNNGAALSLLSPSDLQIHRVDYAISWYGDSQKDDGGWTLEMISLNDLCSGASNWTASNHPSGGTPGAVNSVNNTQVLPFVVTSVLASSPNAVDVLFSQVPDSVSLQPFAFQVNQGIGNPDSVVLIQTARYRLFFPTTFQPQTLYQLSISNTVVNCAGASLAGSSVFSFSYYIPQPFDILVTEIMADPNPTVGLPDAEYVELYNRTDLPVNITGWKLQTGNTLRTIPSGVIPPQGYILLTVNPLPAFYTILNAVGISSFPALSNSGATVSILSPDDQVIHSVSYSISWYRDPAKDDGGWSLEMINPSDFCNGASNWIACQNFIGGTPAAQNSVYNPQPVSFEILSVSPFGNSSVDVIFSQFVDQANVSFQDFNIDPQVGIPDSIVFTSSSSCRLFFSVPFAQQQVYTLNVSPGLSNCAGQPVGGELSFQFTFYSPRQNDVIITEIMADESPSQGLPLFEYAELHNCTSLPLQLGDWKFTAGTSTVSLPVYLLQPGGFVTLTRPEAQGLFPNEVLGVPGFPALTNSGTTLVLRSNEEEIIHSVSYSDTWIRETFKRNGGWSMEMRDRNNPCAGRENWTASVHPDGGTPGQVNSVDGIVPDPLRPFPLRVGILGPDSLLIYLSEPLRTASIAPDRFSLTQGPGIITHARVEEPGLQTVVLKTSAPFQPGVTYQLSITDSVQDCVGNSLEAKAPVMFKLPEPFQPGDVIVNEVLFNPRGDGKDYLEFFNLSEKALDISKLYLSDYDSVSKTISSLRTISSRPALFMPGEYILISTDRYDIYDKYYTISPQVFWDVASMPSMPNSGGSIALVDEDLVIGEAFTFSDKFHFSLLSNVDGVSIERINPLGPTQNRNNWTSASGSVGFGTPGYKNSQAGAPAEQDGAITLSPEIFSPDQDGFDDILFIGYQFDNPGNVLSINIFDEGGRLVKKLVNNEYCGISGEFIWDGGTDNGIMPKIGIYLVVAEWFNADGTKGRAKKTCVLATRL